MNTATTTETFGGAFSEIEKGIINPFGEKKPYIPLRDDSDSGFGHQIEFLHPFTFFIEFDWFYYAHGHQEETGYFNDYESKEVDSIKVFDGEGEEIEINDVLEFRIKNYLTDAIEWSR